jgi:hypothetical protein
MGATGPKISSRAMVIFDAGENMRRNHQALCLSTQHHVLRLMIDEARSYPLSPSTLDALFCSNLL